MPWELLTNECSQPDEYVDAERLALTTCRSARVKVLPLTHYRV